MNQPRASRLALPGVEVFYIEIGEGPPTLLTLHGGMGLDHSYFRPFLDPLAASVRVVYYDQRGNGRSRPVSSDEDDCRAWRRTWHQAWVDDADALRAALGAEQVVLFGHSYGGFLAQEYVLRYPERVAGLILCATAPASDSPKLAHVTASMSSDEAFALTFQANLPTYFHRYKEQYGEVMRRVSYAAAAANAATFRCAPVFDPCARLGEITAPTLVLSGRYDQVTPVVEGGQRLAHGIARSRLVIFEESGHFPFMEEPERFLAEVRGFIASL